MATTTRDDVLARLDAAIAELASSDRWTQWLRFASRFHRYSFGNTLLIQQARPSASRVRGYRAWQRVGRWVRAGERGIPILAPVVRRARTAEADDEEGASSAPHMARRVAGWTVTFVWDVEQTDGADLPEVCGRLGGDDPGDAVAKLLAVAGDQG